MTKFNCCQKTQYGNFCNICGKKPPEEPIKYFNALLAEIRSKAVGAEKAADTWEQKTRNLECWDPEMGPGKQALAWRKRARKMRAYESCLIELKSLAEINH